MTYASTSRRPNPAALAGALGIPGAFGALLVVGLAVTVVTTPPQPRIKGETITETPLPPPPPPTPDQPQTRRKTASTTTTTTTTSVVDPARPGMLPVGLGEEVPVTLPGGGMTVGPIEIIVPKPVPSAAAFDPVGARPRGNPSRWVTNEDYRTRWIREELSGRAAYTLAIDARGQVTGCTITRSTGHAALDQATCNLVSRRARFEPARDAAGQPVGGSYSGTVTWQIPE